MAGATGKKRLLRDLRDLKLDPYPYVSAHPLENDVFVWHANLSAPVENPFAGAIFHCVLKFPPNYPVAPPQVTVCTQLDHPNVSKTADGWAVCSDMLETATREVPYHGWTSAYSVQSVLIQLQSFLFASSTGNKEGKATPKPTSATNASVTKAVQSANAFTCSSCAHKPNSPWPAVYLLSAPTQPTATPSGKKTAGVATPGLVAVRAENPEIPCGWVRFPRDLARLTFEFLSLTDMYKLNHTCQFFANVLQNYHMISLRELLCFHKRVGVQDPEDDNVVLGIGFTPEYYPQRDPRDPKKLSALVAPSMDLLSYAAFKEDGIRHSIWKEAKFTHFLPLMLTEAHASRALPLLVQAVKGVYNQDMSPQLALSFLCKLMNTTVVTLMRASQDAGRPDQLKLAHSERALEGYMAFHHLLLGFAHKYKDLSSLATQQVAHFMASPKNRTKKFVPDIGDFLVLLLLSRQTWTEVASAVIEEVDARNVKWFLKDYPRLAIQEKSAPVSCVRLSQTWTGTLTSKRLLMFQVMFINRFRSVGLGYYFKTMGRPSPDITKTMLTASRNIMSVESWGQYYRMLGYRNPPLPATICTALKKALDVSHANGYHYDPKEMPQTDENHCNPKHCLCSGLLLDFSGATPSASVEATKPRVDLVFLIDATGSMGSYIAEATARIADIVKAIGGGSGNAAADVRFALIAYRDHPPHEPSWATKVYGFTSDTAEMKANLSKLSASGGADEPEAVAAGMWEVLKLPFRQSCTRVVVLIADAPMHGIKNGCHDNHPNGDPDGRDCLAIANEYAQRGIVLFSVGCEPGLCNVRCAREVFAGMAAITQGRYLPLGDAAKLQNLVVSSTKEQVTLDTILPKVSTIYEKVLDEMKISPQVNQGGFSIRQAPEHLRPRVISTVHQRLVSDGVQTVQIAQGIDSNKDAGLNQEWIDIVVASPTLKVATDRLEAKTQGLPFHSGYMEFENRKKKTALQQSANENKMSLITLEQTQRCINKLSSRQRQLYFAKMGCRYVRAQNAATAGAPSTPSASAAPSTPFAALHPSTPSFATIPPPTPFAAIPSSTPSTATPSSASAVTPVADAAPVLQNPSTTAPATPLSVSSTTPSSVSAASSSTPSSAATSTRSATSSAPSSTSATAKPAFAWGVPASRSSATTPKPAVATPSAAPATSTPTSTAPAATASTPASGPTPTAPAATASTPASGPAPTASAATASAPASGPTPTPTAPKAMPATPTHAAAPTPASGTPFFWDKSATHAKSPSASIPGAAWGKPAETLKRPDPAPNKTVAKKTSTSSTTVTSTSSTTASSPASAKPARSTSGTSTTKATSTTKVTSPASVSSPAASSTPSAATAAPVTPSAPVTSTSASTTLAASTTSASTSSTPATKPSPVTAAPPAVSAWKKPGTSSTSAASLLFKPKADVTPSAASSTSATSSTPSATSASVSSSASPSSASTSTSVAATPAPTSAPTPTSTSVTSASTSTSTSAASTLKTVATAATPVVTITPAAASTSSPAITVVPPSLESIAPATTPAASSSLSAPSTTTAAATTASPRTAPSPVVSSSSSSVTPRPFVLQASAVPFIPGSSIAAFSHFMHSSAPASPAPSAATTTGFASLDSFAALSNGSVSTVTTPATVVSTPTAHALPPPVSPAASSAPISPPSSTPISSATSKASSVSKTVSPPSPALKSAAISSAAASTIAPSPATVVPSAATVAPSPAASAVVSSSSAKATTAASTSSTSAAKPVTKVSTVEWGADDDDEDEVKPVSAPETKSTAPAVGEAKSTAPVGEAKSTAPAVGEAKSAASSASVARIMVKARPLREIQEEQAAELAKTKKRHAEEAKDHKAKVETDEVVRTEADAEVSSWTPREPLSREARGGRGGDGERRPREPRSREDRGGRGSDGERRPRPEGERRGRGDGERRPRPEGERRTRGDGEGERRTRDSDARERRPRRGDGEHLTGTTPDVAIPAATPDVVAPAGPDEEGWQEVTSSRAERAAISRARAARPASDRRGDGRGSASGSGRAPASGGRAPASGGRAPASGGRAPASGRGDRDKPKAAGSTELPESFFSDDWGVEKKTPAPTDSKNIWATLGAGAE